MARGEQYVIMDLVTMLLMWHVDNWATAEQKLHFTNPLCMIIKIPSLVTVHSYLLLQKSANQ